MTLISKIRVTGLLFTKTINAKISSITCLDDPFSRKSFTRFQNVGLEEEKHSFPSFMLRFLYGNFKITT
jgi:hypothetical protein